MKTGVPIPSVLQGNATPCRLAGRSRPGAVGFDRLGPFRDAGTLRLLVTFGEKRTRWNAPTAKELGFDIVSYSPYGLVARKDGCAVVKRCTTPSRRRSTTRTT